MIKEAYNKIDAWVKNQDPKVINTILKSNDKSLDSLKNTLYYYNNLKSGDKLEYIFGDKKVTLSEIGQFMIKSMGNYGPKNGQTIHDFNEDCQHSGYADTDMFKDIVRFWKNLDSDGVLSIANGSEMEDYEVDLDGYRCYFLSHSNVYPLIFNYINYTLNKSQEDISEGLYNDNETFDAISDFYPPKDIFLPEKEVLDSLLVYQAKKKVKDFNKVLNNLIKQFESDIIHHTIGFKDNPSLSNKIDAIKKILENE